MEPELRAEEPKLNCPLKAELEPKLRIAAPVPAPFYFHRLEEIFLKKMVREEVLKLSNFNPIT